MATVKSVMFDRELHKLVLANGESRGGIDVDQFLVHVDDLIIMRPTDLKNALKRAMDGGDVTVNITHDESVDEEYSIGEPVSFKYSGGSLSVSVGHATDEYEDEKNTAETFSTLLAPYLKRYRASVTKVEMNPNYYHPLMWDIEISCSPRGRNTADLFRIGEGALALLQAFESGELTRETTLELLRSGNAQVLIGQEEGPWLDVKSAHYNLQSSSGKISIAQAVARFANAEHGGIVVVGMRGKKVPGGEVISGICPVPVNGRTLRSYQTAIEHHLYPPPDYLDIELVPVDGGSLVVLHIPPQPEEYKPFLVSGAIVDGDVEGAFISIVRRRGESSIPITAQAVHATLAAGRALLRRGEIPKN
ncbi:helix-turn-helix domain-containing protein [Streptomyces sp. SAS_269]|uniref:AlbA family DNA-binding domain-containing protein n=1 Tax=Streptomyces sp. SAS_269 TaxID=3412749 RepID=UPI00403D35ED